MVVQWVNDDQCPWCGRGVEGFGNALNEHSCIFCGTVTCKCGHSEPVMSEEVPGGIRHYCARCKETTPYSPKR